MGVNPTGLTERQQTWFATVQASLQRDTGKSMDEWIAIARTCPETRPRARSAWLKEHHGLGANRGAVVLSAAFPDTGWDQPDELRAALWAAPQSAAILEAVEIAVGALPDVVTGQRKQFTAFSRKVQFAAARPVKGGKLMLGLAIDPDVGPRLEPPRNEAWSERLKARLLLDSPDQVDGAIAALLKAAWARS
ncbi:MAG: hypothetical protein JWQ46_2429 [Phenylobacterium sp.]|nr:hypothetical protein [Phenylobacterium sp.]